MSAQDTTPEAMRYDAAPAADAQPSAKAAATDDTVQARAAGTEADRDCADFDTQPDAQDYFDARNGSPDNNVDQLDEDGDGVPCENLTGAVPDGGPDAGGGWLAQRGDAGRGLEAPLAALGLLLLAAAGLTRTRRLQ